MTHGFSSVAYDPAKAYGYQWLQKLGAKGERVKQAEDGLKILASLISLEDAARQERWASQIYANYFSEHPGVARGRTGCDL